MKLIKLIILSIVCVSIANAQQTPAEVQSKTVAIVGGTAHLGNGTKIENAAISKRCRTITSMCSVVYC